MRKLVIAGAVVAASAIAAIASTALASQDITTAKTLHFTAVQKSVQFIDVGAKGIGPGDYSVGSDNLMKSGHRVGMDGFQCALVRGRPPALLWFNCSVTDRLAGGEITFQGLDTAVQLDAGGTAVFSVTGGTGVYQNARGQMTFHTTSNPLIGDETVQLIP
jgi:Allene oxide cyclase barrel like domain